MVGEQLSFAGYTYESGFVPGPYGELHRGHAPSGHAVSVLHVDTRLAELARFREQLADSAERVVGLTHPNVLATLTVGHSRGHRLVVVTEALPAARTLAAVMAAAGALPQAVALGVCARVIAGLAHGHLRGVVHGALHPRSVFIGDDGAVKLGDFAIAGALAASGPGDEEQLLRSVAGHLAPELLSGGAPDPRSDVYAAGALLFHTFSGRTPPEAVDALRVPAPLRALLERALAAEPARRFADAAELESALVETLTAAGLSCAGSREIRQFVARLPDLAAAPARLDTGAVLHETDALIAALEGAPAPVATSGLDAVLAEIGAEPPARLFDPAEESTAPTVAEPLAPSLRHAGPLAGPDEEVAEEYTPEESSTGITEVEAGRTAGDLAALLGLPPGLRPVTPEAGIPSGPGPTPARPGRARRSGAEMVAPDRAAELAAAGPDQPGADHQAAGALAGSGLAAAVAEGRAGAERALALDPPEPRGDSLDEELPDAAGTGSFQRALALASQPIAVSRPATIEPPIAPVVPPSGASPLWVAVALLSLTGMGALLYTRTDLFHPERVREREAEAARAREAERQRLLAAQPVPGEIVIDSEPAEAAVWLLLGRTPTDSIPLPTDMPHDIRIEHDGYHPADLQVRARDWTGSGDQRRARRSVTLRPGTPRRPPPAAPPAPADDAARRPAGRGVIHIDSDPAGAEAWLLVGFTPQVTLAGVAAGRQYQFKVVKDGHPPGFVVIRPETWRGPDGSLQSRVSDVARLERRRATR
jgi:serine/threonine-protein kinase